MLHSITNSYNTKHNITKVVVHSTKNDICVEKISHSFNIVICLLDTKNMF